MWPPHDCISFNKTHVGLAIETGILRRIWRVSLVVEERVREEWTFFCVLTVVLTYKRQCLLSLTCSEMKDSVFFTHCISLFLEAPLRKPASIPA